MLEPSLRAWGLSARPYDRILKVAAPSLILKAGKGSLLRTKPKRPVIILSIAPTGPEEVSGLSTSMGRRTKE